MRWFRNTQVEPMVQYILFTILVVLTPFIVVTRYLQGMVNILSHLSFTLFGLNIPYILIAVGVGLIGLAFWQVRHLTWRRIAGIFIVIALIFISHQSMDLYLGMSFFDLQQNWHYAAYGAYAFFFFRAFNARNMPKNKMILIALSSAVLMSLFDETFQYFMSDRVFDISDIAKDALGVYCGLILVLFVTESYGTIKLTRQSITQRRLKGYLRNPLSALVLVGALALSFILISPLLTEHEYWHFCLLACFGLFFIVMLIIHLFQFRLFKTAFISLGLAVMLLLSGSYAVNSSRNITYNSYGLTIYKGIPLPFFDIIIYPNGSFRLVDKKHYFRVQDKNYFLKQGADIILVGSGAEGKGGKGFDEGVGTHFIFNKYTLKGAQVIILPTPDACRKYNKLKKAGKSVLFVLHNTC